MKIRKMRRVIIKKVNLSKKRRKKKTFKWVPLLFVLQKKWLNTILKSDCFTVLP